MSKNVENNKSTLLYTSLLTLQFNSSINSYKLLKLIE